MVTNERLGTPTTATTTNGVRMYVGIYVEYDDLLLDDWDGKKVPFVVTVAG